MGSVFCNDLSNGQEFYVLPFEIKNVRQTSRYENAAGERLEDSRETVSTSRGSKNWRTDAITDGAKKAESSPL